jgi:hypothetical protein
MVGLTPGPPSIASLALNKDSRDAEPLARDSAGRHELAPRSSIPRLQATDLPEARSIIQLS